MIRTITTLAAIPIISSSALADSITMRTSATLEPGAPSITLSDIAELEGEHATQFADLVIRTRSSDGDELTITVQDVRSALDAAGAHWGLIDLNGWKTNIRRVSRLAEAPQAMTGAAIGGGEIVEIEHAPNVHRADAMLNTRTAASAIAKSVASMFAVEPAHVRLTFDAADRDVLDLSMDQYRIEVQPMSSSNSDHLTLQVRAWQNGRIAHRHSLGVGIEVLTETVEAAVDLRRGTVLTASDVRAAQQWTPGSLVDETISAAELSGRIMTASLKAGEAIHRRDVRQQTLIERGDVVQVRCLVGGVVLSMQAEARDDGAADETIEFRKLGERETFLARVTGRGEAVVDLARR